MCFDVTNLAKTCHKRRSVTFTYSLSVGVVFRLQVIPLDLLALCCENGQSSTILAWCSVHTPPRVDRVCHARRASNSETPRYD
jgi:hypothetical protein